MSRFRRMPPLRTSFRPGRKLRPVEWNREFFLGATVTPGNIQGWNLCDPQVLDQYTQPTIMRIRLNGTLIAPDLTTGTGCYGAMGITLLDPTEVDPAPSNSINRDGNDWMWWRGFSLNADETLLTDTSWLKLDVDVRSMRRVRGKGMSLIFVLDVEATANSPVTVLSGLASSVLCKE